MNDRSRSHLRIALCAVLTVCPLAALAQVPPPCTCATTTSGGTLSVQIYEGAGWIFNWTDSMGLNCTAQSGGRPKGQCSYSVTASISIFGQHGWEPVSFTDGGSNSWTQAATVACAGTTQKLFGATNEYCPDPTVNRYLFKIGVYKTTDNTKTLIWALEQAFGGNSS